MAVLLADRQKSRVPATVRRKGGKKLLVTGTPYRDSGYRTIPVVQCNRFKHWERDFNGLWCDETAY